MPAVPYKQMFFMDCLGHCQRFWFSATRVRISLLACPAWVELASARGWVDYIASA